jgi:outer membrane immunogenic protein
MRYTQLFLAAVSAVAVSASAFAADLPTHKTPFAPAPAYAPAFSWSGPYIGAFAGGNWAKASPSGTPTLDSNGLTVGGLAGWNLGFNGFIIGGEVEAGYDHKSQSAGYNVGGGVAGDRNVSDLGTAEARARGRIGYAWGNVLLFGAGGLSAADLKVTLSNPNAAFSQEITRWRGGFNVGGGVEWAFSDHWTIRGEYIYDRYASRSYDFAAQIPPPAGFTSRSVPLTESTARAVLAYKF